MVRPKSAQRSNPAVPAASPLTRTHALVLLLVAAAIVAIGVTYPMYDSDVWQHLRVGRTIWETHSIPRTDVWTWPGYGLPYVLPSWLFRAVLWPWYAAGGEWGLTAWRWVTTLAMFGIAGATAWRMGARGLGLVAAIVWCGLLYRSRSMVRPETLACVLLAAQMWILESRRRGGPDRSIALILIACLWANVHVSYYLALMLTGFHVFAEGLAAARRRPGARWPRRLGAILLGSAAACFVNPFGWRALWQPFQYALEWRHQPLFQMILELRPVVWAAHERDGLLAWMVLAPALCLLRAVRRRGDLVDVLTYALFFSGALQAQRFLGFLSVAVAPIFARDVADWAGRVRVPAVLRNAWVRVFATATVLVAGAIPPLTVAPWRPGLGVAWKSLPVRACDWMEKHEVRGPSFAAFHHAGYLLWRFWPERERLPFMDIHATGTREDQDLYAACWANAVAWRKLDAKYRFDYVLLPRTTYPGQDLLDRMDADSTWAPVFMDDAAVLYLRRSGRYAELAEHWRYRIVPGGDRVIPRMSAAFVESPEARERLRAELERQTRESEWTWRAHSGLATFYLADGKFAAALDHLQRTAKIEPDAPQLRERMQSARAALAAGRR